MAVNPKGTEMDSVRRALLTYLDAKQHLWNMHFVEKVVDLMQCEPLESFEAIDALLFRVLVCQALGFQLPISHVLGSDAVSEIKVHPRLQLTEIPVILSRPAVGRNRYWEPPETFAATGIEGRFIEFFQWNRYDYLSMSYVRLLLMEMPARPSRKGTEALVEIGNLDFSL